MKKYIIYSLIMTLTCGLGACNNDEDVDKANSIFSTEEVDRSPFTTEFLYIEFMSTFTDFFVRIEADTDFTVFDFGMFLQINHR